MRLALLALLVPLLSACTVESQDQLARAAAKSTVNRVVLARYPELPLEPAINCVIDNASSEQLLSLAADSVTGPTESSAEVVTAILRRPTTVQCLGAATLTGLGG
ncbi:hypothetical protein [Roseivivax sp.]